MGKVVNDRDIRENKIYNGYFILFSLQYLFQNILHGNKVYIRIWRSISELANGADDVKDCMSFQEQKQFILEIATRYFPRRVNDLVIVNMEEEKDNSELFSHLRNKGIVTLDTGDQEPVLPVNCTSLDIAKYLYRACKKNKQFFGRIKKLAPEDMVKKTEHNFPEYYGLIEIACRLNNIIKWIYNHGGAERQNMYDDVIRTILGYGSRGILKQYQELGNLQIYCKQKLADHIFGRIYVSKKAYEEGLRKIQERVHKRRKIAKIVWLSALGLSLLIGGAGGGYQYSKIQQKQEKYEKEKKLLEIDLKKKDLEIWFHNVHDKKTTLESKVDMVEGGTENVYYEFAKAYSTGKASEEELKALIKNELLKNDNLNDLYMDVDRMTEASNDFISDVLIPNNTILLNQRWCDFLPYKEIKEYQGYFDMTTAFKGNLSINRQINAIGNSDNSYYLGPTKENKKAVKDNDIPADNKCYFDKILDEYESVSWATYSVMLLLINENVEENNNYYSGQRTPRRQKQYIVASRDIENGNKTYNIELWKEVIEDITRRRNKAEKALQKDMEK